MKYRSLVFASALLLATAVQAESIDETIDAAADGQVNISNVAGTIEVEGWSKNSVEVTGELGANVEELIFERDGDTVTVKVKVPKRSMSRISSDILVRVPEGSSIDVSGVSADIDVEGVEGDQVLHTVSGDVTTLAVGSVKANSVSGDVSVDGGGKTSDMSANTVSGDVEVTGVRGEVSAEVVSGDVTINAAAVDRMAVETVNGDLDISAELASGGKMTLKTVNGSVDINFKGSVSAEFEVSSFNGDIDNCFGPEPRRTSKYAPGLELDFTEGDGKGSVTIATMNGDIEFCN